MRSLAVRPCFYRVTFGLRASTVNRDCFAFDLSRNVTLPLLPIKYQTQTSRDFVIGLFPSAFSCLYFNLCMAP